MIDPKQVPDLNGDGVVNELDFDILAQMAEDNTPIPVDDAGTTVPFNELVQNPTVLFRVLKEASRKDTDNYIQQHKQSFKEEIIADLNAAIQAQIEAENKRAEQELVMQEILGQLREVHPELFDGVNDEQEMIALLGPIAQEIFNNDPEEKLSAMDGWLQAGDTLKGKMAALSKSQAKAEKQSKPAGVTLVDGATPTNKSRSLKNAIFS